MSVDFMLIVLADVLVNVAINMLGLRDASSWSLHHESWCLVSNRLCTPPATPGSLLLTSTWCAQEMRTWKQAEAAVKTSGMKLVQSFDAVHVKSKNSKEW